LAEVWARRELNRIAGINLSLVVGVKEVDGELLYLNFGSEFAGLQQHAPHTLIAGTTGSGKSVLVLNLILDICAFKCRLSPMKGLTSWWNWFAKRRLLTHSDSAFLRLDAHPALGSVFVTGEANSFLAKL